MKTTVTIADKVFADADRLARLLKISRSRLYSRALAQYIARHSADEVTAALDRALEAVGDQDAGLSARRRSRRDEW